jgi:hypothetical protein
LTRVLALQLVVLSAGCGSPSATSDAPDASQTLPCDVAAVLRGVCQQCHSASPVNGAPIPLVTYADTQAPFTLPPTYDGTPTWKVMGDALMAGRMPPAFSGVTLTSSQRTTLLNWVGRGAPHGAAGACP